MTATPPVAPPVALAEVQTATSGIAAALAARLAELGGEIALMEADLRSPLDADFAEQASELAGQDALVGIEEHHRAEAQAIRAALASIKAGRYGVCAKCGVPIPLARLQALPTATRCVNCAG